MQILDEAVENRRNRFTVCHIDSILLIFFLFEACLLSFTFRPLTFGLGRLPIPLLFTRIVEGILQDISESLSLFLSGRLFSLDSILLRLVVSFEAKPLEPLSVVNLRHLLVDLATSALEPALALRVG
jgi:hypothetical protein